MIDFLAHFIHILQN